MVWYSVNVMFCVFIQRTICFMQALMQVNIKAKLYSGKAMKELVFMQGYDAGFQVGL